MNSEYDEIWLKNMIERVIMKMEIVSEKSKDKIPYTTVNGIHDDKSSLDQGFGPDDGLNWWCNGFWAGMMWMMYHETGKKRYAEIARHSEETLDQCFVDYYGLHHDVGFMWLPTAVADYRLTGDAAAKRRAFHAANLLAGRFNPAGRFIRAWNDLEDVKSDTRGWAIIDCLMNLPLLYWAGEVSQDPRFTQIARMHADTARNYFVRSDGSVRHIVEFNPKTGEMIRDYGGQGYGTGSSWTRGQAWGLYGFVISYLHTRQEEYLDTAKQIAHYFMANIPENGLIPVDFRQPLEPYYYDDSAAAIAACGLIELARHVSPYEQYLYRNAAVKLLKALDNNHCSWGAESDAFLQKCSASYHCCKHEMPMIYGDFFFLEALFKLKGNDVLLW